MSRVHQEIDVAGRKCWTLFDSETRNSYITSSAATDQLPQELRQPRRIWLGGTIRQVNEVCLVLAKVEDHPLDFQADVVDRIGPDEDGREIDVLFGSLAMKLWSIKFDLANGRLDFTHYSRTFVEF